MIRINSDFIKEEARKQGFALCGITKAKPLPVEKERFEKAIAQNLHANKEFLERDIDKRFHPELLLAHCKSVIVCGYNYNTQFLQLKSQISNFKSQISQYAQIKDYHIFMKEKLEDLACSLQEKYGLVNYRITVDSSVISEKAWAVQAGIGYYGKNGIIQTKFGSFVYLGCLLINAEVDIYDNPNLGSCGSCRQCIAVCPTKAIVAPYQVDSNLCISNINLNKNETNFTKIAKYGWLIGCDECQNVCPNNADAPVNEKAILLRPSFVGKQEEVLANLTPDFFEHYFKETTIYKLKYEGLKKRLDDFAL
ncbi:MAG: tRNA epoxyqueuosine(34) reductase QueG [Bacteroidales bacterium]|jgi:epoxyqueuosine reductase|nr:tRNA epoxyqueuosine(34) reductase QueG [Bacteroidales bacterium]